MSMYVIGTDAVAFVFRELCTQSQSRMSLTFSKEEPRMI